MKRHLKKALLILLLPLFAYTGAHKFYVSVTNVVYAEKDDALQITSRIFIDDLEAVFKERYDFNGKLSVDDESPESSEYLQKYLRAKFQLSVNGKLKPFEYIGKKYDNDVVIVYLEIPKINLPELKSIEITNEILTDIYDEQQNIVHCKISDLKKSYVLSKENAKGVLNL